MEEIYNEYDKIGPALVKAIAEIPTIGKNAQAYGYKYATLDDILSVVKPILAKHDLALLQPLSGNGIETIVMHSSGQCVRDVFMLPQMSESKKMNSAQAVGAAITYIRRYALSSMLCIGVDEDTDGAVGQKALTKPVQNGENQGSFSGFKPAAQVESVRPTPKPVEEVPEEPTPPTWAETAQVVLDGTKEKTQEKEKAPQSKTIDWDEKARLDGNLCTKKQASFIYSLAQRALGQDFELEELVNWTEDHGVTESDYVGLEPTEFCGNLKKRDATKVINEMKRLAGLEAN